MTKFTNFDEDQKLRLLARRREPVSHDWSGVSAFLVVMAIVIGAIFLARAEQRRCEKAGGDIMTKAGCFDRESGRRIDLR